MELTIIRQPSETYDSDSLQGNRSREDIETIARRVDPSPSSVNDAAGIIDTTESHGLAGVRSRGLYLCLFGSK